jgi:hypothetical protein
LSSPAKTGGRDRMRSVAGLSAFASPKGSSALQQPKSREASRR